MNTRPTDHPFDPGFTGMSKRCNRLVTDSEGYGVECDLPPPPEAHAARALRADSSEAPRMSTKNAEHNPTEGEPL
jgi:hypothetical protein